MPQADNLYIQNLPAECTEQHLNDIFSPFGTVLSTKVSKNSKQPTAIGFVRYALASEAELAMSQCDGTVPGDFSSVMTSGMQIRLADTPEEKANKMAGGGKGAPAAGAWGGAYGAGGWGGQPAAPPARYSPYPQQPPSPGKGKGGKPAITDGGYGYGAQAAGYGAQAGGY
eukprot:Hpha_TRINITY_DN20552_c0_g1::TRINITY_DN20552_c0_g1_i1::g.30759::m.30759